MINLGNKTTKPNHSFGKKKKVDSKNKEYFKYNYPHLKHLKICLIGEED